MTSVIHASFAKPVKSTVVALHCSLGSGRQWTRLADELGRSHPFIAPDISGYGASTCALDLPLTLAEEVKCVSGHLNDAAGPIHLVGHSYGGAIAFKIATDSAFAHRVRSLTLIEPVLPTLLCESDADRRLHARFAQFGRDVSEDLWNGSVLEAIDKFIEFWNGSGPQDPLPASTRLRMIERADKLAFDFTAALSEENVTIAAASLRVPTLLFSGGTSPYFTQRIVRRLAAIVEGAEIRHLPDAGHMLALSHAAAINPEIARHIARADELAGLSLGLSQIEDLKPPLRFERRALSDRVGEEKS
ncbi:alpha/beta hydrolase [Bradyrhizobium sp. KBS0727]|uniref:alpha/beta fold hydrolase n=1 Tax=unclassified Bradyrhizobium TaxID=2631580 RepID=UPI00110EA7E9|nr:MULTISPECIES: alpha/beta fold hydrolase [unclassified Bradyrhizobium]QDW38412.1 alpha/beta hydrolase [Bradyrhizobium sp. KBS0725]QDW45015.1 alpha/beta hydrolase [Bradyrhizobium sp. KBS0727]